MRRSHSFTSTFSASDAGDPSELLGSVLGSSEPTRESSLSLTAPSRLRGGGEMPPALLRLGLYSPARLRRCSMTVRSSWPNERAFARVGALGEGVHDGGEHTRVAVRNGLLGRAKLARRVLILEVAATRISFLDVRHRYNSADRLESTHVTAHAGRSASRTRKTHVREHLADRATRSRRVHGLPGHAGCNAKVVCD